MSAAHARLWRAVLDNAISEAGGVVIGVDNPTSRNKVIREARQWLTNPSEGFDNLCEILDLDPVRARQKFKVYVRQIEDNGGTAPKLEFKEIIAEAPAARVEPMPSRTTTHTRRAALPSNAGKMLFHNGRAMSARAWAQTLGISATTIHLRMKAGMPLDQVLSPAREDYARGPKPKTFIEYNGEWLTARELSERTGMKYETVLRRHQRGLPIEEIIKPVEASRPGGGSRLSKTSRDRRGTLRARVAEIGVFTS